jgi:hypothetical protein
VDGAKLAQGSVTPAHLAFLPIAARLAGVSLAFGNLPYVFQGASESIELTVPFEIPFSDESYVLIAMSDHPSCSCFLQTKREHEAVLQVIRTRLGPEPQGRIQWVAIGR